MRKPKSDYSIQTVANALRLLEAFQDEDELGVSELSRRLDLHKNNVFRLLATLGQSGYIEQSARSERYRLGARCLELGRAFARGHSLLQCSRPVLEELATELGETAHVGVLRDFEVVHLDAAQPSQLVLTSSRVGTRLPAHCTALGKAMLGCSETKLREVYDRTFVSAKGLRPETDATIVDRDKFFEHLRAVSVQGFALDLQECATGLVCAAAPVYDESGVVVAAISVSGPTFRLDEEKLHRDLVPRLVSAAHRVSQALGHA